MLHSAWHSKRHARIIQVFLLWPNLVLWRLTHCVLRVPEPYCARTLAFMDDIILLPHNVGASLGASCSVKVFCGHGIYMAFV